MLTQRDIYEIIFFILYWLGFAVCNSGKWSVKQCNLGFLDQLEITFNHCSLQFEKLGMDSLWLAILYL